jgi:enoyl-CoA hydratase/carnithine racemase
MNSFTGTTLSWSLQDSTVELELHRPPANEIGTEMLAELEQFISALDGLAQHASCVIIYSSLASGFSAGADLRELYHASARRRRAPYRCSRIPASHSRRAERA